MGIGVDSVKRIMPKSGTKTVSFYGGPLHEHEVDVEFVEGKLPDLFVVKIPPTSQLSSRWNFAVYELRFYGVGVGRKKDPRTGYFIYSVTIERPR
jgi:hypothetical protein